MRKDDRRETQKCTTIILYHKSKDLRHFMYNCIVNEIKTHTSGSVL